MNTVSDGFIRILPADPWLDPATDAETLTTEFRGKYASISVCQTSACTPVRALAAFYGHTSRPTPLSPSVLRFSRDEVETSGGTLTKTDAHPPWPSDYNDAHHDVGGDLDAVAAAMAARSRAEPARCEAVDRMQFMAEVVALAVLADAPDDFKVKVRRRLARIQREEPEFYADVVERVPEAKVLVG